MERVGVMDCGAYSTKSAVVSHKSRQMSDVQVAEALTAHDDSLTSTSTTSAPRSASAHWARQLPPAVSPFAEVGADITLLLLLDVHVPQHEKENLLHLSFESVGCQHVSLCYAAATSLFAVGQVSGVTVDVGFSGVRVTPITRGVVDTNEAFSSCAVGAARVDDWLRAHVAPSSSERHRALTPADLTAIKTHFSALDAPSAAGEDDTNTSAVKAEEEAEAGEEGEEAIVLPDGEKITVKMPRHAQHTMAKHLLWSDRVSVPHALRECCENLAIARGEVYPWLLTGASANVAHVRTSLADALKVSAVCTDAVESRAKNPAQAAVEGGVILSQLSTFKGMCVSAETYAEEGPQRCVHMKVVDHR